MADSYRSIPQRRPIGSGRKDSVQSVIISTNSSKAPTIIFNDGIGGEAATRNEHSVQPVEPPVPIQDELDALRLLLTQGNADVAVHSLQIHVLS